MSSGGARGKRRRWRSFIDAAVATMSYQNVVQPVRIGGRDENGQQRTACSLELVAERAAEATTVPWVDWEAIPVVAGFTRQERAVWCHCWRNGAASGTMLGLTP